MQSNKSNGQLTAQINVSDHKKSGFDLSHNVLGTGKIGRIIPTGSLHVMPGDTIKGDSKVAVQFEPLAVPILANMDVKQEKFYVPYNVVWKNWDKFISGGEEMDYKGVAPSVSAQRITQSILNVFSESDDGNILYDAQNNPLYYEFFTSQSFSGDKDLHLSPSFLNYSNQFGGYNSIIDSLNGFGDSYQVKDLLKPCYDTLNRIRDYISYAYDNDIDIKMDYCALSSKLSTRIATLREYNRVDMSSNKYIEQIIPALAQMQLFDTTVSPSTLFLYLPDEHMMELIMYMYDYYKIFFGLSSNLDYLNMMRITFADFLLAFIVGVSKRMSREMEENEDLTHKSISIQCAYDSNMFSDMPMTIFNLRANYAVWYHNYRDILLETKALEPQDGDVISDIELVLLLLPRQRCWEKDAFTTALTTPGTGNVGVPVSNSSWGPVDQQLKFKLQDVGFYTGSFANETPTPDANNIVEVTLGDSTWQLPTSYLHGINSVVNDNVVNSLSGFSLYALDAAQRAQKWLQKALFFGNRISDFYYMHFGVRFLDARLRLPELLTSSSELVKLDVVMNNTNITTEANGQVYQSIAGDRAAYASAYDNGTNYDRFIEEHGVIMSYLTIMPQVTYAYGMNRDYSRIDQFDYAFAEFATLGMDAVYDTEITASPINYSYYAKEGSSTNADSLIFGYQGKYYDYKAKHSEEHGELLDSQDMYTFARKFDMYSDERPKLNYEFVHCFPDLDMFVVEDTGSDYFRYDLRHSIAAERELPAHSIYI